MSSSGKLTEVARLASLVCDQEVGEADAARLDQLLLDDLEAQAYYLRHLELDVALGWQPIAVENLEEQLPLIADVGRTTSVPTPVVAPAQDLIAGIGWLQRSPAVSIALVGLLFYGTFALFAWNLRPDEVRQAASARKTNPLVPLANTVTAAATLTAARDCRWAEGSEVSLGSALSPGFRVSLDSGIAEFTFADGATVELVGPSVLLTSAENEAQLELGKLTAHVPPQAIGFRVATGTATIVDLGTEFGVSVATDGATEVHVLKGLVEARANHASAEVQQLHANQAMRFEATMAIGSAVTADGPRFVRQLSGQRAEAASDKMVSLPLSEILPGSEIVSLVANGDFEDCGAEEPGGSGQFPRPEIWERDGHLFVGALPSSAYLPANCGRSVALGTLDQGIPDGLYQQALSLQAETEYVLSAYLWNFGDARQHAMANVDLGDAPGEAALGLGHSDDRAAQGHFVYRRFHTSKTGSQILLRVFFDANSLPDGAKTNRFDVAWDHIALTKASRFVPPLVRVHKISIANPAATEER